MAWRKTGASAGFDAQVVHDFHKRRDGRIRMSDYVMWGVRTFLTWGVPRIRVEIDGRRLTFEVEARSGSDVLGRGRVTQSIVNHSRFNAIAAGKPASR